MKIRFWLALGVIGLASATHAQLNVPVPSNAFIVHNGFDWAWASPVPADGGALGSNFAIDLSFQGTLGWRIPSSAELLLAPLATDFLVAGGNVPFNGSDPVSNAVFLNRDATYASAASAGALAVPYFIGNFQHGDWSDGLGQVGGPWAGMVGSSGFADQLVIRNRGSVSAPEPGVGVLVVLGLGMFGGMVCRRRVG